MLYLRWFWKEIINRDRSDHGDSENHHDLNSIKN